MLEIKSIKFNLIINSISFNLKIDEFLNRKYINKLKTKK